MEVISREFSGGVGGAGTAERAALPLEEFSARNLRLAAPASRPSPSGLFSSSLGEAGGGEGGRAGAPGGGDGLGAGVSAPRASHHLAEPLLKTHPSVRADTAFLPEEKKIIVSTLKINTRLAISTFLSKYHRARSTWPRGQGRPPGPGPGPPAGRQLPGVARARATAVHSFLLSEDA